MQNKKVGQSTFDYLILTVVILIVIVPLLFFSTTRIDTNRVAELQDALNALQEGVTQVNNLGFGTSSVVIVRIPKGVTEQRVGVTSFSSSTLPGQPGLLQYRVAGNDLYTRVFADVEGILPVNEGLHHIQLFNNGTNVLLYECGNNRREAFEQCDGTESSACGVTALGCAAPSHSQACSCFCFSHQDCRASTGLCGSNNVCVPCSTNSQCAAVSPGQVCLSGQCVDPTLECTTNADCNYPLGAASGSLVCNRQAGRCEPCDVPPATPYPLSTGALKDCNPGHSCQIPGGGVASWCGIPPIGGFNLHPSVDGGLDRQITLPINQVSLDGTVTDDGLPNPPGLTTILRTTGIFTIDWTKQSGPGIVTFGDAQSVDTIATFSQAGDYILRLTADDSQDTFYDELTVRVLCATNSQCTYPTQVCVSGTCERCTTNSQCTAPDQCMNGICAPRQACTGTTCANGYVCSNGFCTPCGGSVSCPSGTCNAATGQCGSTNAICGNLLLEPPVEQCERPTDCTPRPGHTSQCLSCACNYVPQGVMCGNGYKELGEQCETAGQCPFAQGFTIACTSCRCEYTPLIPGAVCGNGVLESPPEQCEGNNFNHCSRYYLRGGVCHSCRCYYDPNAWGNGNTNDPTCEDPPCASGPTCTRVGGTTCSNNIDCANYGTYGGYCGPDNCCNPYTPNGSSGTAQTNNPR